MKRTYLLHAVLRVLSWMLLPVEWLIARHWRGVEGRYAEKARRAASQRTDDEPVDD